MSVFSMNPIMCPSSDIKLCRPARPGIAVVNLFYLHIFKYSIPELSSYRAMNTSRDSDLPQFKSCRNNQQHQEPLFASSYVPQCSQTSSELQHLQLDDGKVNDTEQYKDFKNSHVLSPCLHRQQEQQEIYSKLMQMHSLDQQRGPLKTPPVPARSRPTYTVKSQYQSVDSPASNFNTLTDSNGYIQNAGQSSGNMSTIYSQVQHLDNSPLSVITF